MPECPAAQAAVENHCAFWNAGDRESWSAIFSPGVTFEDPVGAPVKHGAEAVRRTWADSHLPGRDWTLTPTRIITCGTEAAVTMLNQGVVQGRAVIVESVEIWRVDEAGRVTGVRAFFAPEPGVQTDYFQA